MTLLPKVKLKSLVNFPSQVIGGAGINVSKANGKFTFDLAFDDFGSASSVPPADAPNTNVLTFDTVKKTYLQLPYSGGGGGIPDAPNDGTLYGRKNLAWSAVPGSITGRPIVVFADGQSNILNALAFSWTPNPNAFIWNNTQGVVATGTAFIAISPTVAGIAEKLASDIADANPSRTVYLIKNGFSGEPISHWLVGTGAPDCYANGVANVVAALAAIGRSKIDYYLRWQGESDATPSLNTSYVANYATMMTRYWGNAWFPQETPMVICGVESVALGGGSNFGIMNDYLIACVNADPDKRRFLNTASLASATYWDATNPFHMTGQGYFSAGALASSVLLNGPGRASLQSVIVDPASGKVNVGNTAVPTATLTVNNSSAPALPTPIAGTVQHIVGDGGANLYIDTAAGFGLLFGRRSNGTIAAPTTLTAGDIITGFAAIGYDGTSYGTSTVSGVFTSASGTWTAGSHGTYVSVFNTPTGSTTVAEHVRFQPSGGLSLGTAAIASDPGAGNFNLTGGVQPGSFTVAALPAGIVGKTVWCSNARVFNGAGVQEGAGAGTGGLVTYNGSAWKLVGTNTTAIA